MLDLSKYLRFTDSSYIFLLKNFNWEPVNISQVIILSWVLRRNPSLIAVCVLSFLHWLANFFQLIVNCWSCFLYRSLQSNYLSGSIPSELGNLSNLLNLWVDCFMLINFSHFIQVTFKIYSIELEASFRKVVLHLKPIICGTLFLFTVIFLQLWLVQLSLFFYGKSKTDHNFRMYVQ